MSTGTLDRAHDTASDASPATEPVTVHRRRGALALVGVGAAVTALAYLWRAVAGDAGTTGWVVALALLPVAGLHLAAWWDARVPLLVADETGIRLRDGRAWTGLRWDEVDTVSLAAARQPRRDARLEVGTVAGAGRPLPLAMVDPADVRALPEALRGLAPAPVEVREPSRPAEPAQLAEPAEPAQRAERAEPAEPARPVQPAERRDSGLGARLRGWRHARRHADPDADADPPDAGQPAWEPSPGRFARADVVVDAPAVAVTTDRVLRDTPRGRVPLVVEEGRGPGAEPATSPAMPSTAAGPAARAPGTDAVIGAELVAARRRLRLSVDDLAVRTRIRPHVIEAMEADDFSACGGDVYARGHLRVLARVLGTDAEVLVAEYERHHSAGPVTARKVFEAKLAGPGRSVRTTTGGPRWSVLIGVLLVLVLLWGLARLFVPGVDDAADRTRGDAGAKGAGDGAAEVVDPDTAADRFAGMGQRPGSTRLLLSGVDDASTASQVTVRSGGGDIVYQGSIGAGDVERVEVSGPAVVTAQDAGVVTAAVNGRRTGPLGTVGEPVRRTLGDG